MGSICTVASYKSPAEIEVNKVTRTSNYNMPEPRNATNSPPQCEPAISVEESKEGSTFGSKVLPLPESERIVNASRCTMITEKDVRNAAVAAFPFCGNYFSEVPQLVEHATPCKDVSEIKATELSLRDGSPSSPVIGAADCMEDPSTTMAITEADHDVDGGSAFDDVKSDEDHEDEEDQVDDEGDVNGYELSSFYSEKGSSDDGCFDAVVNSEATTDSAEFERCPHCYDVFPLPYLVDHAYNCTGSVLELNKAIKTTITTGPLSISPTTECSIASYDLPKYLMSKHYPKCERKHFLKSRSEGSITVEEFEGDPVVPPEHFIQMDDLSTRWTTEDDWSMHSLAASRTTKNESTDREAEDSKGLEWISSPYSYYDCEEQCLYCLEMFPVSVLVEHACNCPSRQEISADEMTDFGQCCYCLQRFHLKDLLNHAPNCDHKTISSSDVLERCIHCFKDFPVSELIHHSQNCRGGMSGPRERFHGFTPSVHDLSAISSAAILNDTQHKALDYVITRSAQDSKSVTSELLARVQRLGYSENDLKKTLQWVRSASPIIIHINLDKVLKFLVEDTNYRNRFETGTSGGSTDMEARKSWEDRIFNKAYHSSPPSERVKYGVLNIVGDPRGVRKCAQYGDSFLQLKKVRLRTTFASQDTSSSTVKLSCCEHYENVLFSYTDQEIKAIIDVATGKVPFHRSDCISQYKEVQIHGPVSLSENVECIVVNPRHKKDSVTTKLLDRFVEQNKCNLIWMDPDDLTEAGPSSLGGRSHYLSARSLLRPSPHKRSDKWRRSSLCETRASFPAESKRRILTESKPRTISDSKRETHSDSKPTVFSGIKPETFGKPMPSFASESRYRTFIREPKSSILSEKKSGIRSESKPGANSESKFRNLSDSKPRTISSSRLSYRDTTRIRTRRPATAGRRERWSSLRDSSREKYPYF